LNRQLKNAHLRVHFRPHQWARLSSLTALPRLQDRPVSALERSMAQQPSARALVQMPTGAGEDLQRFAR